nr:uncharacterized protein LOC112986513 [Dromaius novaehollandiae]
MVKTSGKGFLGVYNPDPHLFHNFIMLNEASSLHKNRPSSATPPVKSGHEEARFSWEQSLRASNSTPKIVFTGILNPTTCIDANVNILFIVSKEHYPIYDVNNLCNTNAEFDWGDFRSLAEEIRKASSNFLLFLFQFQHPGTYVLRLSSNQHKKMVCIKESCVYNYDVPLSGAFHVLYNGLESKEMLQVIVTIFSHCTAFLLKRGDIWEPEEQIDLESFNTNVFFELLLRQSLSVTAKLGDFKEEVKTIYRKLTNEISSLKELWIMTLSIPEESEAYESTMIESYLKAKQQAEEEMQHRKQLAAEYEESMNKQVHLLHHDLKCQEEHYVMFNSALREAVRLVEMLTNQMACRGNQTIWSPLDYPSLLAQIDAASSKMTSAIIKESHRLKAWGVLGEGMGAYLLNETKTRILTKQELVDSNGTAKAPDVVHTDPITGLLTPNPQCTMLLNSHCPEPVPINHFLHPETGKVLPVAGNIGYDPIRSRLVCAVDSASGELRKSEVPIFPYVPYPVCPNTGLPVKTKLPVLCPEKMFRLGGLMLDPVTEIEVPVLAVTVHPHTGQKLSIGGTYLNPLTGTVTPLEIGGPMTEPEGGKIVPILGVSLDNNTGK